MPKFRRKPTIVEAVQYDGAAALTGMLRRDHRDPTTQSTAKTWGVDTINGFVPVRKGDWVVKDAKGFYYPIDDEVFKLTYEAIDEPTVEMFGRYAIVGSNFDSNFDVLDGDEKVSSGHGTKQAAIDWVKAFVIAKATMSAK